MPPLEQQLGPEEPPPLVPPGHLVGADPPPALGQHLAQVDTVKGRQDRQGGNLNGHPLSPSLLPPCRGATGKAPLLSKRRLLSPAPGGQFAAEGTAISTFALPPTYPCGMRRTELVAPPQVRQISIRPPLVGDDASLHHRALALEISIHAPRGGRPAIQGVGNQQDFISIPTPARGIVEGTRPTPRHYVSICPSRGRRHRRATRTPAVWAF